MRINVKTIKMWSAGIVIAAAALIVVPSLLNLAASLVRLLLMVVIAGGACLALAHVTRKAARIGARKDEPAKLTADTESNSAEANHVSS